MKTEIRPPSGTMAGGLRLLSAVILAAFSTVTAYAGPTVATIGGGVSGNHTGYQNGETALALFNTPMGLALDSSGDLFIADYGNNAVREVLNPSSADGGTTSTYATNHISAPVGVAIDGNNNLYVLNRGGTGAVSTNGSVVEYDMYGILVATNATHLTNAAAIALDTAGNIYVTERSNLVVEISGGTQTTIATVTAPNALLKGIAVLAGGNLAVCDFARDGIYTINPGTGIWTTNAGFNGQGDGTGPNNMGFPNSMVQFFQPFGIAAAGDGTVIVSDFGNDRVKVVTVAGVTTNFYGVSSNDWVSANPPYQFPGWVDGTVVVPDAPGGVASRSPAGLALSRDGSTLYTTEDAYHILRQVTGSSFAQFVSPPAVPANLTAVLTTNGSGVLQVLLTWTAPTTGNATNYLVEHSVYPNSTGPFSIIGQTPETTFTDPSPVIGTTNYYVVQAANSGGLSGDSSVASVSIPTPPPAAPTIGWFDYGFISGTLTFYATFHGLTNGTIITFNDLNYAIAANESFPTTLYVSGQTPLSVSPITSGTGVDPNSYFQSGLISLTPLAVTTTSNLTIQAVNQGIGGYSAIASATIIYQCGPPGLINATNAALFYLSDVTTNVTYYYTTDGSDPLNNMIPSQSIVATNGVMPFGLNISSNFVFSVRAFRPGYLPSTLQTNVFLAQNFAGNELTWGFASGYCSSKFVGSPGEIFYAPVTLTTLPGAIAYSMDFDMVVTNLGSHPVPSGAFDFSSMLVKPIPTGGYTPIYPYAFVGNYSSPPPPSQLVNYNGTNFVNLVVPNTNLNELAVGWFEMYGKTNLYDTKSQNLLTYSMAFIDLLPSGADPNGVIVGGYSFQIPTNAVPGEQYQIQLQRPSADDDGYGGDGSAVIVNVPMTGSLTNGAINGIKIVTVGQPKYLAGDVYPFAWFNAGDFGNGDLITYSADDVQAVFDYAIYGANEPQVGSDFYDAMDSAGGFGAYDAASGYWTNANLTASVAQKNLLFNVNDATTINQMAFGDGILDICDVWVTLVRSQFPNLYWFQRFYTNDTVNGVFGRVAQAITTQTNVTEVVTRTGGKSINTALSSQGPVSITNTPSVHFAAGDYIVTPGTTNISIPVTATVYGPNPMRMLMFNVSITPLDGSPALTAPVTFSANAPFSNASTYNIPSSLGLETNSTLECAEGYLPKTFPISSSANLIGSNVIGYLNIAIPANATSMSSYALSFTHASASPNGLISFPKTTYTGLITLSSRTNSYYNDGIPDSWRLRYFGSIYNQLSVSNADADGTSMNNWQKYQAGLNPTDPTSVLNEGVDQPMAQSPQDMVLYWPSVTGKTYIIERSPTLFPAQWTAISTNIGTGTYMEIHDTSGGPKRYYQVTTQ